MSYVLELENYKGPIEKLLELVEKEKMEVTLISVSKVTDQFLAYFEELKKAEVLAEDGLDVIAHADLKAMLADFLVVVSRLVLLKSRVLLPTFDIGEEEEGNMQDLELRLKIYKELMGARGHIINLWRNYPLIFSREFLQAREPIFFPPSHIVSEDLFQAATKFIAGVQQFLMPVREVAAEAMSLKSKIEEIISKLSQNPETFSGFHKEKTRSELVVLFLAILHLVREQIIHAEQDAHFGNIFIAKKAENS